MASTKKLVSENEKCRENFFIVSHFLKKMGWWHYWKEYVLTTPNAFSQHGFNNGVWFDVYGDVYSIFGNTSFSSFLKRHHNINVWTVLDLFVVFTFIFYNDKYISSERHIDDWAIKYLTNKGYYNKWLKEVELTKSNG